MITLYNHQKEIIDKDPQKAGFWLGTGTGKSITALMLAEGRTLVVCPKVLREDKTWQQNLAKIDKQLDLKVISKEDLRKLDIVPNHDTLIIDEADTCLGVSPNVMYRNKQPIPKASQLFYKLYSIKDKPKRLYLLTATIMKSPMTVWAAAVILGKASLDSHTRFRDIFYVKLPMGGRREVYAPRKDSDTKDRLVKFAKSLGFTGRLEGFMDVPEQTFRNEYVELTNEQLTMLKEVQIDYPDPLVRIGKKCQVENGILVGDEYSKGQYIKDNKIEKIQNYSIEFPKMIVFARYSMQIQKIKDSIKDKPVYVLDGKTKDRGEMINMLKTMDEYVLIVNTSISAGWELPECPVMMFASRDYSFVNYTQSLGRIHRANNLKKNLYINLIARGKTVDSAIDKALESKQDFDERLYVNQ